MSSWSSARNNKNPTKLKSKEVWVKVDDDDEDEDDEEDDLEEEEPEVVSELAKSGKAKQQIKTLIKKENQEEEERDKKPLGSILKKSIQFGASSGCMLGGMLSMLDVYGVVTKKGLTKTTMMREISRAISFNIIYMAGYC